jgi:hypothetical protein
LRTIDDGPTEWVVAAHARQPGRIGYGVDAASFGRWWKSLRLRHGREADVDARFVGRIHPSGFRNGMRRGVGRRELVHHAGQRAEVGGAVCTVSGDRGSDEHLQRFGQCRIDRTRACHSGSDALAGEHLIEDGSHGEHAGASVAGLGGAQDLRCETTPIERVRRRAGEAQFDSRDSVRAGCNG